MKKVILLLIAILLTGCNEKNLMNTPTKKVEMFLKNYQTLSDDVISDLNKVTAEEELFNTENREKYIELMKKHYQKLTFEIKDEKIDGNTALVTVEIEVNDYSKALKEAAAYLENNPKEFEENGKYNEFLFIDYKIKKLSEVKDTVKYTLDLTLSKIDDVWTLDNISNIDEQKINGVYDYS